MPREAHIERQVHWKNTLQKYGCNVNLERTVYIRNAPIIVDVYAEAEGKIFLIEIGDISDKRKIALIQFYAEHDPNIEFIHEDYGENKIGNILESVTAYRNTPEYNKLKERQRREQEIEERIQSFNAVWMLICLTVFIICIVIPFMDWSLLFLMGIAFLMPFVWFFGFIVGNRIYASKKRRVSEEFK